MTDKPLCERDDYTSNKQNEKLARHCLIENNVKLCCNACGRVCPYSKVKMTDRGTRILCNY